MPYVEWVSLCGAVVRLQDLWRIPSSITEQIVRNVVQCGEVPVRGVPRGQQAYQIITKQVPSALFSNSLYAADYENIEIDWNGLVEQGRELIPPWMSVTSRMPARPRPNKSTSSKKKAQRRGPVPGAIDRYNDEALFPEIERMTCERRMSVHAAAFKLAHAGKVEGSGTPESRASRLAKRYRQRQKSLPLIPTNSN